MTAAARLSYIPDLVEEHFDELQFLWTQRRNALRAAYCTERSIVALEDRIAGHAEGMLVIGERLLEFVEPALTGEAEMPAFAAAFALLRLATPAALTRVIDAFERSRSPKLAGLRDALAHGPSAALVPRLTSLFVSGPPELGGAAGEILAFQGAGTSTPQHLERLLRAEEPAARAAAWRVAAYTGLVLHHDWLAAGLHDDAPAAQRAALTAAAWTAAPAFASFCRGLAAAPAPEAVEALTTFAAVARPEDYQVVEGVATNPAAGPDRFSVIGSFAHPYFIDLLIHEMSNPDPAAAVAAGAAFFKMTGRDVESDKRVKVAPDGKPPADDFEAEFMDEVFLPDPELARKHWQELAPRLANSPRICRGMDVSQPLAREQFALLDMESRWEYCLRMRLFGGWQGTPLVLERYPQRF